MAIKFEKVKAGMTLWSRSRQGAGNTTMTRMAEHPVYVVEVDAEKRRALVSWNGNAATWHGETYVERLFLNRKKSKEVKP